MIVKILCILSGLIFASAGLVKMFDLVLFEETFVMFNILPQYSKLFSIIIPSLEVVAGAFLIIGIFRKAATIVLVPLVLSFTFAIWINLRQGFTFDCGCFGPLNILSKISTEKLLFNITLVLCLALVFFKDKEKADLLNHLKILLTYAFFIAILIYIPFSNHAWEYTINIKNIVDIDWETANIMIKNNDAVLFDTRTNNQYEKEHVPSALSLPYLDFNKYFRKYDKLSKDAIIIVYCDGKDCSAATRTGYKLIARGYKNIFKVKGGLDAWNAEGWNAKN